jgi:peptide/nickel transport system ATP-binding protein
MNAGRIVEETTTEALRAGTPREAYTRQLLVASRGYDRAAAAAFRSFD